MPLLIDGYNLLHVTGLTGRGGAGSFEQSRAALLSFLGMALGEDERAQTTVVFDASEAPPGLPNEYTVHGMQVSYARHHESADEMLEELIAAHHSPKRLTVVSSDHRVQRAAKRRKATAVDSHVWYAQLQAAWQSRGKSLSEEDHKPDVRPSPSEVAAWLQAFGPIDTTEPDLTIQSRPSKAPAKPTSRKPVKKRRATKTTPRADAPTSSIPPSRKPPSRKKKPLAKRPPRKPGKPPNLGFGSLDNLFPPGYGEDVENES